ncbi:S1 family peptidase [Luteibacter yeojuensis]
MRLQDYRGEPQWKDVPDALLFREPYCRICEVITQINGVDHGAGSGWYWTSGQVLTAAHVVFGTTGCRIRFANRKEWLDVLQVGIPPEYAGPEAQGLPGSQRDRAILHIIPPADMPLSTVFDLEGGDGLFSAIGFLDGCLKEHAGPGEVGNEFVAHSAHTSEGHSGCPVFHGNRYCGVHTGSFRLSRPFMGSPERSFTGFLNSAIKFGN